MYLLFLVVRSPLQSASSIVPTLPYSWQNKRNRYLEPIFSQVFSWFWYKFLFPSFIYFFLSPFSDAILLSSETKIPSLISTQPIKVQKLLWTASNCYPINPTWSYSLACSQQDTSEREKDQLKSYTAIQPLSLDFGVPLKAASFCCQKMQERSHVRVLSTFYRVL